MQASERLGVSVLPMSGGRLTRSFLRNLMATLLLWAWNEDWPPVDVVVEDRLTGAVVFKHRAWGQVEGEQLAERLRQDAESLSLQEFLTEWNMSLGTVE